MLRLLAQREQGYEDMASLMGLSVEEVRAKVKEALAEIDGEDAPAAAAPAPPAVAPAAPAPSAPTPAGPSPTATATESSATESPAAATPVSPPPAPAPAVPAKPSSPLAKVPLPSTRRRWIELIGGAAIVLLVILFATGTIDLGDGGSDSHTTSTPTTASGGEGEGEGSSEPSAATSSKATKAVLTAVPGGEGVGLALFGRIKKTPILQVEAKGLRPSAKGQSYTVWLYRSPKLVLRIGAVAVGKSGTIAAQFPVPAQVLAYVAGGAFDQIDVSLTDNASYEAEVAKAKKARRLPAYTGKDVLRGEITGPAIKKK
jgi:hypothetical protein